MAKKRTATWKAGILILAAGVLLLLSALLLFRRNRADDRLAGERAGRLLADIESAMAEQPAEKAPDASGSGPLPDVSAPGDPLDAELPTVEIDGYGYVGQLEIPALELELPVMSEWDYGRLQIAPCRQFGSSAEDLVIAAHNYSSHFGRLQELAIGDSVVFTDIDGLRSTYSVGDIRILRPTETKSVQQSGFDLVLYTCTYGGKSRVAVFCSLSTSQLDPAGRKPGGGGTGGENIYSRLNK